MITVGNRFKSLNIETSETLVFVSDTGECFNDHDVSANFKELIIITKPPAFSEKIR